MNIRIVESDWIMWEVYQNLHIDLFGHTGILPPLTVEEARTTEYSIPKYANPYRVKARAQLQGWLKRYRFAKDVLSDSELEQKTNAKFLSDQLRIGTFKPYPYRTSVVLQKARKIISGVLGAYKEEDIFPFCRFSRNSTVGFGHDTTYLDHKINPDSCISGTPAEIEWFDNYLKTDPILSRVLNRETDWKVRALRVSHLNQVNVPKTAVIMRPVRPNTLIGSFRSIGLGNLVASRLRENLSIDLNYLQPVHQALAREGSRRMHNVTADLSSASDSFTPHLLNRLLPRKWYNAFKIGRTPYFQLDKKVYYSPSFMAMGIGFTFSLMTLCFTAILLALQQLTGLQGRISVFGDDLIYPVRLHPYVIGVFNDINFQINTDKTFITEPFRESCGGDFFDKVDVRPARPEGVSELLAGRLSISSYVYKLFNALIRRWEEVELPRTFQFLRQILAKEKFLSHSVPSHFPDTSGFKDGKWHEYCLKEEDSFNLRKPFYQGLLIPCIQEKSSMRPVGCLDIFLWEKLQSCVKTDVVFELPVEWTPVSTSDILVWKRRKDKASKSAGKAKREFVAYTARKGTIYLNLKLSQFSG